MGGKIVLSFNLTTTGKCPSLKLAFHSHLHGKLAKVVNILATTVTPMAEARGDTSYSKNLTKAVQPVEILNTLIEEIKSTAKLNYNVSM
jgi:hypothetical protein